MPRLPDVKRFVSVGGVKIYRIPYNALPDLTGRVYLVLDGGPPTLVDAGSGIGQSTRQILGGLHAVRTEFGEAVGLGDIRRIVITHGHLDHVGGLGDLVRATQSQVGVHLLDRRIIEAYDERATLTNHALACFMRWAGVAPERQPEILGAFGYAPGRMQSAPVDFSLEDGQQLDGLRIVHTPGHSPGHVCLVIDNVLLTGDHVLARTISQQWPESVAPYTGLGHYLESLEKVDRIGGIDLALGGHEPPIRDLPKRIDEIRASHLRRLDRVLGIIAGAPYPLSIDEITEKMYSRQKGFRAMLALTDVASRVEYLDQRGRLAIANIDEVAKRENLVYRYRPA